MPNPPPMDMAPSPLAPLLRLAWPIGVSMLSYSARSLVSTLFVGRLGGAALAAVGLGGIAAFTLHGFGMGLFRGTQVLVAQAVGAGRRERVPALLGASLALAVVLGLAVAALGPLAGLALARLPSDGGSGPLAERYVALRLLGTPLGFMALALRETRNAMGDSRSTHAPEVVTPAVEEYFPIQPRQGRRPRAASRGGPLSPPVAARRRRTQAPARASSGLSSPPEDEAPRMLINIVRIRPEDNVAVATRALEPGALARSADGVEVGVIEAVPYGHKVALRAIDEGDPILKYGEIIGHAARRIEPGECVHTHNVRPLPMPDVYVNTT